MAAARSNAHPKLSDDLRIFVDNLLYDWESDQYQIFSELDEEERRYWEDEIKARRTEWERLGGSHATNRPI
jgi:hypothetical protein